MSAKTNHFKLGLFVLIGMGLLIGAIIVFSAGALSEPGIIVETYVDESVQGLDVGSPVKYRGVQIGNVEEIAFVGDYYPEASIKTRRYVLIQASLRSNVLKDESASNLDERLKQEIEEGMRVRLSAQGITGLAYLEVDYVSESYVEPLKIEWKPQVYYVPSAPSRIALISESVEKLAVGLEKSNVEGIANNINELITTIKSTVQELKLDTLTDEAIQFVTEARETNEEVKGLINSPETRKISKDASETVAAARRLIEGSEKDLLTSVSELREGAEKMSEVASKLQEVVESDEFKRGLESFERTSQSAEAAAEEIPETLQLLKRNLRRLDMIMAGQQDDYQEILSNMRQISHNILELTEDAKRYPSHTLFGDAPEPSEPAP